MELKNNLNKIIFFFCQIISFAVHKDKGSNHDWLVVTWFICVIITALM